MKLKSPSRSCLRLSCRYLLISFAYVTSSFIFVKVGLTVMIPEVQLRPYNQLPVSRLTEASAANQSTSLTFQRPLVTGSSSDHRPSSGNAPFSDRLIVHVTWFYKPHTEFRFHEALCLLAIQRFVQPRKILFWYDAASTLPTGAWWQFARQSVAHLLPVPIDRPTAVFNISVDVPEHQSDIARLAILEEHGGLYVDLDLIVVRTIDDLIERTVRRPMSTSSLMSSLSSTLETESKATAKVVMGAETPDMLGSGFILAPQPGAEFIRLWRRAYSDGFQDTDWNRHSVYVPMQLARLHPQLIHIEWFAINRPNWYERDWLYGTGRLWDWSVNYAVHLWYRDRPRGDPDYDPVTIRQLNTTVGEVFRLVYYGHPRLLPPHTVAADDGVARMREIQV